MALNEKPTPGHLGGVIKLDIVKWDKITNDSLTEFEASEVLSLYFTQETGQIRHTQKKDAHGSVWQVRAEMIIPKVREELIGWIEAHQRRYFVLIAMDGNGLVRRIGSLKKPLELLTEEDTGRNYSSRNEYQFTFSGNLLGPSPVMSNYAFVDTGDDSEVLVSTQISFKTYNLNLAAGVEQTLVHNQNTEDFIPAFFGSDGLEGLIIKPDGVNQIKVFAQADKIGKLQVIFKKQLN